MSDLRDQSAAQAKNKRLESGARLVLVFGLVLTLLLCAAGGVFLYSKSKNIEKEKAMLTENIATDNEALVPLKEQRNAAFSEGGLNEPYNTLSQEVVKQEKLIAEKEEQLNEITSGAAMNAQIARSIPFFGVGLVVFFFTLGLTLVLSAMSRKKL